MSSISELVAQYSNYKTLSTGNKECKVSGLKDLYYSLCGVMVTRLTPDQKVACSNHVRVSRFVEYIVADGFSKWE